MKKMIMVITPQSQKEFMNEPRERERKIRSTPKGAESFYLRFTLITQIVRSFSQPFDLIIWITGI